MGVAGRETTILFVVLWAVLTIEEEGQCGVLVLEQNCLVEHEAKFLVDQARRKDSSSQWRSSKMM